MTPRATARLWPSVLASVAALAATAVIASRGSPPSHGPTRVAIRVACASPMACDLAAQYADDIWSEQRGDGLPLDIVVTSNVLPRLAAGGLRWTILVPDVDAVAEAETARLHDATAARPGDWFAEYKDYTAITEYLAQLARSHPERISMHGIGTSIDGRTIWAYKIGSGTSSMLINGTQHAREWIAAMTTTCVADRLVREYDRDPAIKAFVDRTSLWVVPVVNPDGYQWSWSNSRYWRKNRRGGHGVDLNRNWSVAWGGAGSSGSKRSDIYRGESAFSEPESAAVRDLARRERPKLAIDFHSYGQLILYPWNYTAKPSDHHATFTDVGQSIATAMLAPHGMKYTPMSGVELYPAAGTAQDFMYGDIGALAYTIELRPKGGSGFVLPPEQIRPTCDEGLAAVLSLASAKLP